MIRRMEVYGWLYALISSVAAGFAANGGIRGPHGTVSAPILAGFAVLTGLGAIYFWVFTPRGHK